MPFVSKAPKNCHNFHQFSHLLDYVLNNEKDPQNLQKPEKVQKESGLQKSDVPCSFAVLQPSWSPKCSQEKEVVKSQYFRSVGITGQFHGRSKTMRRSSSGKTE